MSAELFQERLDVLHGKFLNIQHYQRIVGAHTEKLLQGIFKSMEQIEQLNLSPDHPLSNNYSINSFTFRSPYNGELHSYGFKTTTTEESIALTHLHHNKQYQWLLVEAYEAFEDFIVECYACAGFIDTNFWKPKDYDGVDPLVAKAKGLQWFMDIAKKNKKSNVKVLLATFRNELVELGRMEKTNALDINLRLALTLIEKLRHIIVHKNGKTDVLAKVTDDILKACNLTGHKSLEQSAKDFIDFYFDHGDHSGMVLLVDYPQRSFPGIKISIPRHSWLLNMMLCYALVLKNELKNRFSTS